MYSENRKVITLLYSCLSGAVLFLSSLAAQATPCPTGMDGYTKVVPHGQVKSCIWTHNDNNYRPVSGKTLIANFYCPGRVDMFRAKQIGQMIAKEKQVISPQSRHNSGTHYNKPNPFYRSFIVIGRYPNFVSVAHLYHYNCTNPIYRPGQRGHQGVSTHIKVVYKAVPYPEYSGYYERSASSRSPYYEQEYAARQRQQNQETTAQSNRTNAQHRIAVYKRIGRTCQRARQSGRVVIGGRRDHEYRCRTHIQANERRRAVIPVSITALRMDRNFIMQLKSKNVTACILPSTDIQCAPCATSDKLVTRMTFVRKGAICPPNTHILTH